MGQLASGCELGSGYVRMCQLVSGCVRIIPFVSPSCMLVRFCEFDSGVVSLGEDVSAWVRCCQYV
jgi:hypothetical protein